MAYEDVLELGRADPVACNLEDFVGQVNNERVKVALSFGMLVPIAVFGVLAELQFPMTLLAGMLTVLIIRMLWRRYALLQKAGGPVMV